MSINYLTPEQSKQLTKKIVETMCSFNRDYHPIKYTIDYLADLHSSTSTTNSVITPLPSENQLTTSEDMDCSNIMDDENKKSIFDEYLLL
jgi:hypothetical protein